MPTMEVPFTPGQRVRTADGVEFEVGSLMLNDGTWHAWCVMKWIPTADLTLVEPLIDWQRRGRSWTGGGWNAASDGYLFIDDYPVGNFQDPRAVAEETQRLWNARKR